MESQREDLNIIFSDKEKKPPPGEIEARMLKIQVEALSKINTAILHSISVNAPCSTKRL